VLPKPDDPRVPRLSAGDAALFGHQIAGLTAAGLPLASGLLALGEELPPGRLRRVLGAVSASLGRGDSLDQAIAEQRGALPEHLRGLVLAGERTGRLGEVLARFAAYTQIGVDVRRRLWLSLAYPIIALGFTALLLLFILVFIVSGFDQIFKDFNLKLPLMSVWLIAVSQTLRGSWIEIVTSLAIVGAVAALALAMIGPAARRSVLSRIPLLGPVWRWTSLAEFCHLLGLLLESSVPLPEALPMASAGVVDADVRHAARDLAREIEGGGLLAGAITRRSFFPEGMGRIVDWAEFHQCLPESLHMLGGMFEARARAQATFSSTVFTVLTLFLIVLGVGTVIMAVFAPLIQTIQMLSG
jgi:general secretion pathway protein F